MVIKSLIKGLLVVVFLVNDCILINCLEDKFMMREAIVEFLVPKTVQVLGRVPLLVMLNLVSDVEVVLIMMVLIMVSLWIWIWITANSRATKNG